MFINNRAEFSAYGYSGLLDYKHSMVPEETDLPGKVSFLTENAMKLEKIWNCEQVHGTAKIKKRK